MSMGKFDVFSTKFAQDIYLQKYSMNKLENWADTAKRVTENVCNQLIDSKTKEKIYQTILERKFIPGGRYLYSSGRSFHQVNNCFLFRAEDSRESWADIMAKATSSLMSGGGIGIDYSNLRAEGEIVKRTGGTSTGPLALVNMVNESGRYIMQGGQRRSAIWAGLNWKHNDIPKFLKIKNYSPEIKAIKEKDFLFPVPLELTNISVIYDTEFFVAAEDESHPHHQLAMSVWMENCLQSFSTAEPGMSFNFCKDAESLRNACVTGDTEILTDIGNVRIDSVVDQEVTIWNGFEWSTVTPKITGKDQPIIEIETKLGKKLVCTDYHKFYLSGPNKGQESQINSYITASQLKIDDQLIQWQTPMGKLINDEVISIKRVGIADTVYCFNEPKRHTGIFNGVITGQCTEVTSEDDSDKCNLGTLWINRIKNKKELADITRLATTFLLCGSIYSDVPTDKIREVGNKNNRIGLGLGGIHEWLMARKFEYEVTPELHKWLSVYEQESDGAAFIKAKELNVSVPKGVRAIAPTGTIGIIAETTTGIEPLFCKSYKRRYFKDGRWLHQYVVDGTVKRLMDQGISLDAIKDSYDLTFKQRVKFQADVQNYVDMSISSTCNVPPWGSEQNNGTNLQEKADILLKYGKRLRGFTVYPDGCRGGQPLTRVDLNEALNAEGQVFEETENTCLNGVCGI